VKRVGAPFTPVPCSPILEAYYLPNAEKIVKAAKELLE
jgi:pyruvate/2-oxoglutarate/acetoin dehydrogenase E1 component